jgi:lantibiotic modifying enzyme
MIKVTKLNIENKLHEIYQSINSLNFEKESRGLITGKLGRIIFIYNYTKYFKSQKSQLDLENILNLVFGDEIDFQDITFAEGLSGIGFHICYLIKEGVLEPDDFNDLLKEIDDVLIGHIDDFDVSKDFDFLYGLIGLGNYFLERTNNEIITVIIKKLNNWGITELDHIKWVSENYINEEKTKVYDIGLAHGLSSIIIFLSKCLSIKNDINTEILLRKSLNFLEYVATLNKKKEYPAYIIIETKEQNLNNRLAWCYGYLGISIALLHAANALNDDSLKEKSIEICLQTTAIDKLKSSQIMDAGICHGSSGVAHIYNKMFFYTGRSEFKVASDYWKNETLAYSTHIDGLAGYKAWNHDTGYYNEYGLLEGVSGIGLVLLGFLTDDIEDLSWDRSLLLS